MCTVRGYRYSKRAKREADISKRIQWVLIFAYLATIYATLGIAPRVWEIIDAGFGGAGRQVAGGSLLGVMIFYLIYMVFVRRERSIAAYYYYFMVVFIFILLNFLAEYPAEKIHLFEYFILGIMVLNVLDVKKELFSLKKVVTAIVVCVSAGIIDEVLQYILPGRVFDWRDIGLNSASSFLAFIYVFKISAKKVKTY